MHNLRATIVFAVVILSLSGCQTTSENGVEVPGTSARESMFDGISNQEAKFKLGLLDGVNWGRSFCRSGVDDGAGYAYKNIPANSCDCYFLNSARFMTEDEAELAGKAFLANKQDYPSSSEKWVVKQIFTAVAPLARSRCGI